MSVGPVFSGVAESVQFRLESEGEEILNGVARLFYKYRGLERIAEGRQLRDVVLLAERLNGSAAFAHGLALCQAAEALSQTVVPERAQQLRVVFAEVERLRSHTSQIADLAESTGLAVPTALLSSIVEDLLRLSQVASRHRYLMGVVCPGGLTIDLGPGSAERLGSGADRASAALIKVVQQLERDNGFLDRVEQVGILTSTTARHYGVVGPMGRASGVGGDLRTAHPYAAYKEAAVRVAGAEEGDAYARLRVLVAEAMESSRLITQGIARLAPGPVQVDWRPAAGAALGWVEAPAGAAFHWLRLDALGTVQRWRVMPGSFTNWHALTPLVEGFSFQDFPIILASLGLSVAESDR